jgi:hypothetical protein
LSQDFSRRYNTQISQNTIRRRLAEHHLLPFVPATGPLLTADHRRRRLESAREHLNWQQADWAKVLFSDESRFCRFSHDRRMRVYRRPGERYTQCNVVGTVRFGGGSVMVWGGISWDARTELVVVNNGRLNAHRYMTSVLEPHVVPYAPYIGENFLFMHDNARPHVAQVVTRYLHDVGINTVDWPARSPDLNPIEHLWDHMGRQVKALQPAPINLNDLGNRLVEIWDAVDQDYIRHLTLSMGRRCQAVVTARGRNTRY